MTDENGKEYKEEREIAKEVAGYFDNLFTSATPHDCEEVLEGILKTISEAMNRKLIRAVEDQEIKRAFFSMQPNKALGPDGMTSLF